ncbi:hypothetical protein ELI07_26380 (plasmid) [Rhizobium leguminosarum]|nr:hypothetical protein ELI40_33230 [Rhizobium leguminosarum]TAX05781.1 hypothetical protein ELI07_26380 [Rhizobium leguminosarum]TAY07399.1 hypothetical protein ELH96_27615 [Rhizobium leguminosarum]TAZ05732.1 hypothetical protein ELH81_26105 [Rhizobium leguminosarum]
MTAAVVADVGDIHVVYPGSVPHPNWLRPGIPSAGQQAFGDDLLRQRHFVAIPSAVSRHRWNLIFLAGSATGAYALKFQEAFALDTRLHLPRHERALIVSSTPMTRSRYYQSAKSNIVTAS